MSFGSTAKSTFYRCAIIHLKHKQRKHTHKNRSTKNIRVSSTDSTQIVLQFNVVVQRADNAVRFATSHIYVLSLVFIASCCNVQGWECCPHNSMVPQKRNNRMQREPNTIAKHVTSQARTSPSNPTIAKQTQHDRQARDQPSSHFTITSQKQHCR